MNLVQEMFYTNISRTILIVIAGFIAIEKGEKQMSMTISNGYFNPNMVTSKGYNNKTHSTQETASKDLSVEEAGEVRTLSPEEEMAVFKKEFYNDLAKIKSHRTVVNMAVNISEEAFENMKADSEYREKVLSLIQRDAGNSLAPRNGSILLTVGATVDDYRGDGWPVCNDSEFHIGSQNSFYKRTSEKKDRQKKLQEEFMQKRLEEKQYQKELLEKRANEEDRVNDLLRSEAEKAYENQIILKQ